MKRQPFLPSTAPSLFWFSCFLWSLRFPLECWHQSLKSWAGTDAVPVRVLGFWHQKLTLLSRKKKILESHQVVSGIDRKPGESNSVNRQEPKEIGTREDSQGHTTENHSAGTLPSSLQPPAANSHSCHWTLLKKRALPPRAWFISSRFPVQAGGPSANAGRTALMSCCWKQSCSSGSGWSEARGVEPRRW